MRVIQYPSATRIKLHCRGVLDTPHSRGMTGDLNDAPQFDD
jgi:hypothetical protein